MNEYAVILHKTKRGVSAHAPDLPGCAAVGRTEQEVMARMAEAMTAHLRGLREDRIAAPRPATRVYYAQSGERGALQELKEVSRILQNVVATGVKTTLEVGKQTRRIAKRARR
jgi:predicted RNase H-like HicB family nuclease